MMLPDEGDVHPFTAEVSSAREKDIHQFVVHCKSRWRIRSEPSLSAVTLGTIAPGTVVVGYFVGDDGQRQEGRSSWISVVRFEAANAFLGPDYYGGEPPACTMYCYRRNGDGYGLYEMGVESIEGLRSRETETTQRGTQDVTFTWQLLGAADEMVNFLNKFSPFQESIFGVTETLDTPKRASDLFAQKEDQRLRKAARHTGQAATVLMQRSGTSDLGTASLVLPVDLRKPFLRLAESVLAADTVQEMSATGEGSLQKFIRACTRIDQKGKRKWLSRELQQEFVSFSQRHGQAFEQQCRVARSTDAKETVLVKRMSETETTSAKDWSTSLPVPLLQAPPAASSSNSLKAWEKASFSFSPRGRSESISTAATESSPLSGRSTSPPQFADVPLEGL